MKLRGIYFPISLFVVLFIMSGPASAQTGASIFSKTFFSDSGIASLASVQNTGNEIVLWTIRNQWLCLAKIDASLQSTSAYYFSTVRRPITACGLAATSDGGYIASCQLSETDGLSGCIIRIDKSGGELWRKTLFTKSQWESWDGQIVQLPNGDFIVAGMMRDKAWYSGDTVLIERISSRGDSLWLKKMVYPGATLGSGRVIPCVTSDSTFIINVSQKHYPQGYESRVPITNNWRIIEMNFNGEIILEHAYPTTDDIALFYRSILPARGGGWFLCGAAYFGDSEYGHCAVRIDARFNVVWSKTFKTFQRTASMISDECRLLDVMELDTGTIVVGGFNDDRLNDRFNMVILALDSRNGDRLWNQILSTRMDLTYNVPELHFYRAPDRYPVVAYMEEITPSSFYVTVHKFGVKSPPRFSGDSSHLERTVSENSLYLDSVSAIDTFPGARLTYLLAAPSPSTMVINESTGVLQWTPTKSDTGSATVTVMVQDQAGQRDTLTYHLRITNINNRPVFLSPKPDGVAYAGYSFADSATANDEDSPVLFYSVISAPAGLTVAEKTGNVDWLPMKSDTGDHIVSLRVDDGSLSDTLTYTVHVENSVTVFDVPHTVAGVFRDSCSLPFKFSDRGVFRINCHAAPCPDDTITVQYRGYSVSPNFSDVVGFFFDLSGSRHPAGCTISFAHPALTDNYTFAVRQEEKWISLPSEYAASGKTLQTGYTAAERWVAVDKSAMPIGGRGSVLDGSRHFDVQRSAGRIIVSLPKSRYDGITCMVFDCKGALAGRYVIRTGKSMARVSVPLESFGINKNSMYILVMKYGLERKVLKLISCN